MSIRNLDSLFNPDSIAVIGASTKPRSVGSTVMRNLLAAGFDGPILPVNPRHRSVAGVLAYPDIATLPVTPELAVICTPPRVVPGLIVDLAKRGTRSAIVITAGQEASSEPGDTPWIQQILDAARPSGMRILGPNCVGMMVPGNGVNASFAHANPMPGNIAFVTQSGALTTAVLDWATSRSIGFSSFISLGNSADIDFGDMLDYLGGDPETHAILLYIESIKGARKFVSAARSAARNKPILAVKSGRVAEGARAAASHTGALAGADDVYQAAFRRAGILRVETISSLFTAVETLARGRPQHGDRLAICTNGGGPGVMATDALILGGGKLARLSPETHQELNSFLPSNWSRDNPVDMIGDADAQRYVRSVEALLSDPGADAVLVIHAPVAVVASDAIAAALVPVIQNVRANVLTCWLGSHGVAEARSIFSRAGIPTYSSPEQAVAAFLQMVSYNRNQEILGEIPPSESSRVQPDLDRARIIVKTAIEAERNMLTEPEAKEVLAAHGIPVVATRIADSPEQAEIVARSMNPPLAVKIVSPDISHKSDVGGVALDLESPAKVREAADAMLLRLRDYRPDAAVTGFAVQEMARRPEAHELIVGAATDPIFGPVILFGQGGTAVEVIRDRAIALPPLNLALARDLVNRTRVSKLLDGYRNRPPADLPAIYRTLHQVSRLLADLPEVVELDINPLFADPNGVLALDARIRVAPATVPGTGRFTIRPYPRDLEETIAFNSGLLFLRPILPEDLPAHQAFFGSLTDEDIELRFFGLVREMPVSESARYTQIDFDREMAFVAIHKSRPDDEPEILGVVRGVTDPDNRRTEAAVIVRSDLKGRGLGRILLAKLIRYCRDRGTGEIEGRVTANNPRMLNLARDLGFQIESDHANEGMRVIRLKLND